MKRTPLKKKSKSKIPTLKNKLWKIVSEKIRERDKGICQSCGKTGLSGSGYHGGHLKPDAACSAWLRYHPHNLGGQCYYCNINLGGNGSDFLMKYESKYGFDYMRNLLIKERSIKADEIFYMMMIENYSSENWEQDVLKYLSTIV